MAQVQQSTFALPIRFAGLEQAPRARKIRMSDLHPIDGRRCQWITWPSSVRDHSLRIAALSSRQGCLAQDQFRPSRILPSHSTMGHLVEAAAAPNTTHFDRHFAKADRKIETFRKKCRSVKVMAVNCLQRNRDILGLRSQFRPLTRILLRMEYYIFKIFYAANVRPPSSSPGIQYSDFFFSLSDDLQNPIDARVPNIA
jgi:hypothetical protein